MTTVLARLFRIELDRFHAALVTIPPELADTPWRQGGWTRKQIVGHLLDSATNNRQRFVRASADGHYEGPQYAQDEWVAAHDILAAVVDRIPENRLEANCIVGDEEPVTLRFLIEDYLTHQRGHFAQLAPPLL
jgi:hypothetical protein